MNNSVCFHVASSQWNIMMHWWKGFCSFQMFFIAGRTAINKGNYWLYEREHSLLDGSTAFCSMLTLVSIYCKYIGSIRFFILVVVGDFTCLDSPKWFLYRLNLALSVNKVLTGWSVKSLVLAEQGTVYVCAFVCQERADGSQRIITGISENGGYLVALIITWSCTLLSLPVLRYPPCKDGITVSALL